MSPLNKKLQNIIGSKNQVKVTRALDQILTSEADEYRYFDPKIMRPTESMPKSKQPISQAVVFMIGGGSFIGKMQSFTYSFIAKLRIPKFDGVRRVKKAR